MCACKGCVSRHPGCHDRCPQYAEYKSRIDAVKAAKKIDEASKYYATQRVAASKIAIAHKKAKATYGRNW